mmetsp:Transcript_23583/g.45090  ORF Transcript_23583/g.45090 Transcript_23583/m.45090 type:complete len:90 (-) Transcript_23583:15-284(-)
MLDKSAVPRSQADAFKPQVGLPLGSGRCETPARMMPFIPFKFTISSWRVAWLTSARLYISCKCIIPRARVASGVALTAEACLLRDKATL